MFLVYYVFYFALSCRFMAGSRCNCHSRRSLFLICNSMAISSGILFLLERLVFLNSILDSFGEVVNCRVNGFYAV